jgi:hypothetical protein
MPLLEDVVLDRRIILKWILRMDNWSVVDMIHLAEDRD